MKIKTILLILITLLCLFFLTGCYNANGIETKAYVVALGLDVRRYKYIKTFSPSCYS